MLLKGGERIRGDVSRVGLTSPPQLDTGGIEVRIMSGEILLDTREEGSRRKSGFYQEDSGVNGIPFGMGCSLTPVSLLQLYIVIASRTSQVLCPSSDHNI